MSQPHRLAAAALLLAAGCATMPAQNAPGPLWADLEAGSDRVGFRDAGEASIWYPAASGGRAMRLRDYADTLDELDASLHARHFSDRQIVDLLDRRMFARRDAQRVAKKFTVAVIVTRDGETGADYAPVAEFLASHGYVIAAVGAKGSLDGVEGNGSPLFLHNLDVTAWTLASEPVAAKKHAENLLAFLDARSAR